MKPPKRLALIGHRGVGKTSLLSRIEKIYRASGRRMRIFDLDREIEQQAGRSVSAIFHDDGEAVFRRFELTTFEKIEKEIARTTDDVVIALGAGYPVTSLKKEWHAIWVRRPSDETGRIFTDRPRLDARTSALEEFRTRFDERSPRFAERADDVLFLDEGVDLGPGEGDDPAERDFFLDQIQDIGGALTLLPENFTREFGLWLQRRVAWGFRWFELRDDLLSEEQMSLAVRELPREKVLVSYRHLAREAHTAALIEQFDLAFDWPLERAKRATRQPSYLSLHENGESIEVALARLEEAAAEIGAGEASLKAALQVANFDELMAGHAWQMKDPSRRVFLPMSPDGRWSWYRLLRGNDLSLNFLRESGGSASDQPTLLQWVRRKQIGDSAPIEARHHFAAVLGDPVSHSRTPMEQAQFFRSRGISVVAVKVSEEEWRSGAIPQLISLGLVDAAITAPLKVLAYELVARSGSLDEISRELRSVNTMHFAGTISGTNTDLEGLRRAIEQSAKDLAQVKTTVVWGGGGTLDVIKRVLPRAQLVSVRTQTQRDTGALATPPDLVVWAANLKDQAQKPPPTWRPKIIFDLNYSEASPARDYAINIGARYISGLAMFKAQAQAQRAFWSQWGERS